jgi:hypothetical protein
MSKAPFQSPAPPKLIPQALRQSASDSCLTEKVAGPSQDNPKEPDYFMTDQLQGIVNLAEKEAHDMQRFGKEIGELKSKVCSLNADRVAYNDSLGRGDTHSGLGTSSLPFGQTRAQSSQLRSPYCYSTSKGYTQSPSSGLGNSGKTLKPAASAFKPEPFNGKQLTMHLIGGKN